MAWTAPRTWVANVTAITALALNTDLRDNLLYLKGLLDGTGGAVTVTVPDNLQIENDANFTLFKAGNYAYLGYDANDYAAYDRTNNYFNWFIGGANKLQLDGNGMLTGAGFYDSGATSVGASSTVNLTHGFAARPRFVWGWQAPASATLGDTSGTTATTLTTVPNGWTLAFIYSATASVIRVDNTTGSTVYVRVFAML